MCKVCKGFVPPEHQCFMKTDTRQMGVVESDVTSDTEIDNADTERPASDTNESEITVDDELASSPNTKKGKKKKNKKKKKKGNDPTKFIFFDFECTQESGTHIPIFLHSSKSMY